MRLDRLIEGPAGPLETVIEAPANFTGGAVAVICHPHPLFGGTLTNKVVHTLARACQDLGAETLRFNFRGVGASAGIHDNGIGEVEDALAVVGVARERNPRAALWLAGFSFGGMVAFLAAQRCAPQWLVTVAPALRRFAAAETRSAPPCPWLIVQGDADELVPVEETAAWAATMTPRPTLRVLPGCEHFFHGRCGELRDLVLASAPGKEKPG